MDGPTWRMVFRGMLFPMFDDVHLGCDLSSNLDKTFVPIRMRSNSSIDQSFLNGSSIPISYRDAAASPKATSIANAAAAADDWVRSTCQQAHGMLIQLFVSRFPIAELLLADLISLLNAIIFQESAELSAIGVRGWGLLLQLSGLNFTDEHWNCVVKGLAFAVHNTLLYEVCLLST